MDSIDIKKFLPLVRRPSRYIGGEVNSIKKDLSEVSLKYALAFPDSYEVGMSHLGMQILYQALNAVDEIACERVFAPWTDMEALLREKGVPLSTLESGLVLGDFDIIGFSLQYELSYTNVLMMLDLGGIAFYSAERDESAPFVFGGGPLTCNPEPVADFFDAFLLGDGEEAAIEMALAVMEGRKKGLARRDILRSLAAIKGVYVPSFFTVSYNEDNTIKAVTPVLPEAGPVQRRIVMDMDSHKPVRPIVPFTETIHDRVTVEINRGCTRGCRFCQAGMIYRPIRERSPAVVMEIIDKALVNTGYDDVSLLSLSAGDYSAIEPLMQGLMKGFVRDKIALSLPSLRVGTLGTGLASEIKKVRKTGFTLAPEAGTERLRSVINKGITEEDLLQAVREIFTLGWKSIKLYFMIGLPTETEEDVTEIAELASRVKRAAKSVRKGARGGVRISVSVSSFIPKPFTPFQWEPQVSSAELRRLQGMLRKRLSGQTIDFKWHDPEMSRLEGIFARGDRRLTPVIERAFLKGCRFDGWGEKFNNTLWEEALSELGVDAEFYTSRRRGVDEVFAWDHLSTGVDKGFLYHQYERSVAAEETPDCRDSACPLCGVCDFKEVKNIITDDAVPSPAPKREALNLPSYKVGLGFSKRGDLRFLGHLELVKVIKRLIRRVGFTVKYSSGFHPMPKLSFSPPIPLGTESLDEFMEMTLLGAPLATEDIIARLNMHSPEGLLFFIPAREPLNIKSGSDMIQKTEYRISFDEPLSGFYIDSDRIDGYIKDFDSSHEFPVTIKKGDKVRTVDIKSHIVELRRIEGAKLSLVLAGGDGPSIRPCDVLVHVFHVPVPEVSLIPILKTRSFR